MPWHQSVSDPRKFYDSAHQVVAVAQTADQAALIVRAVNAMGAPPATIPLREPATLAELHYGTGPVPEMQLETFHDDDCCKKYLIKGPRANAGWICPKCGTQWQPRMIGEIKHWAPVPDIQIFR